jgi:hypothetical protein
MSDIRNYPKSLKFQCCVSVITTFCAIWGGRADLEEAELEG